MKIIQWINQRPESFWWGLMFLGVVLPWPISVALQIFR